METSTHSSTVRLRKTDVHVSARKKYKSDSGSPMKRRNLKRKLQEKQNVSGIIKFYAENEQEKIMLMNKVDRCKMILSDRITTVTNGELLNAVLDSYLNSNMVGSSSEQTESDSQEKFASYLLSARNDTEEEHFLTSTSALRNICTGIQQHHKDCGNSIRVKHIDRFGHVGKIIFECQEKHNFKMDTSPHIVGGRYLGNMQTIHGVYASGLRFSQYERFCENSNFGQISESTLTQCHDIYCDVTKHVTEDSIIEARQEEEMMTIDQTHNNNTEYKGISILTDARHATRRNAKQSDIIALGNKTHKTVGAITVTKDDDPVSQRHELFGVKQLYKQFDDYGVAIDIHGHDRNASVNKFLRTEQLAVENANDTWHASKGVAKALKHITGGPKCKHGHTWHAQLSDKAASVKTHTYYAMRNCNGSTEKLRKILDNTTAHYQDNHENCSIDSRCKTDHDYIPSKVTITDPTAASLLTKAVRSLQIYKTPEDFVHCVDTHYVESFNNACLVYHDKRISFRTQEYTRRTNMAVLDWNENVDRDYTSISMWEDPRKPRRQTGKKNLKAKTFNFKTIIWNKVMDRMYQTD